MPHAASLSSSPPLSDARWAAIATRDAAADGRFVYAVATTGVYCRPSCPARTPRRANVRLFGDAAAAEAAGFRACRRCRPDGAASPVDERILRACRLIDERVAATPEAPPTLPELAEAVGWSRAHLQRTFSRAVGMSPRAYAEARRLERAQAALGDGQTVLAATYEAGFGSGKALYERADDAFGMTPGAFRRGGAGLRIRYALFDTALGCVLVAATPRGVCRIALGDAAEPLVEALCETFHAAELARDDAGLRAWAEPVLCVCAGAPGTRAAADALLALPLDIRGTAFQRQVWQALRRIPMGETRTYGEVAASIGRPKATRAVAQACGANPVALAVPCHRVVGADGALRGYRWGPERKRRLLETEAAP